MHPDLQKAKKYLIQNHLTCVLCKEGTVYKSADRGITPLLQWHDQNLSLTGFSAADKVVGKGAAFMYIQFQIRALYAEVISERAQELLQQHGIAVFAERVVKRILNRNKTGFCPIESAVLNITEPDKAVIAIRNKLKELIK